MATNKLPNDGNNISLDDVDTQSERDGVAALHDTEAEAGDEEEVDDLFELDKREARDLGVALDSADPDESRLD